MKQCSFTEARQNFASILDKAKQMGVIYIRRRNGDTVFVGQSTMEKSPLDITGVDLQATGDEIVESVREGRKCFGLSWDGLTVIFWHPDVSCAILLTFPAQHGFLERWGQIAHCAYKETTQKLPKTLFMCAICDLTPSPVHLRVLKSGHFNSC